MSSATNSSSYFSTPGYNCANCGAWVPQGITHTCPSYYTTYPSYAPTYPTPINYTVDIKPLIEQLEKLIVEVQEMRKDIVALLDKN